ncbi:MAG: hypothetical protein QM535_07035 [Limnohabitans sp.]|nr:hypothetical protein [Limnohabitans sp.]
MKKLALIIAIIGFGISAIAQNNPKGEKLTPDQQNQLQLKRMTLEYDLTPSQQKDLAPLLAGRNNKKRERREEMKANKENHKQLSANEKFEIKNKMLDEQIEFKSKMKKILTKEQFEKWEQHRHEKMKNIKHRKHLKHLKQNQNHPEDSK